MQSYKEIEFSERMPQLPHHNISPWKLSMGGVINYTMYVYFILKLRSMNNNSIYSIRTYRNPPEFKKCHKSSCVNRHKRRRIYITVVSCITITKCKKTSRMLKTSWRVNFLQRSKFHFLQLVFVFLTTVFLFDKYYAVGIWSCPVCSMPFMQAETASRSHPGLHWESMTVVNEPALAYSQKNLGNADLSLNFNKFIFFL